MWQKAYRDYKKDEPLIHEKVESGRGIVGCEMHDLNGWGETWHHPIRKQRKKGLIRVLLDSIFGRLKRRENS